MRYAKCTAKPAVLRPPYAVNRGRVLLTTIVDTVRLQRETERIRPEDIRRCARAPGPNGRVLNLHALGHPKQCQSIPAAVPAGVTSASPAGRNHADVAADGTGGDGLPRRGIGGFVSSVGRRGLGRGQRSGVAVPSAATIPARTSGGSLAHAATSRARSASDGAWPTPASGHDVGWTGPPAGPPVRPRPAPRFAPGAARAAPGAARCSESAYSPGDSASARGFDSPRLHFRFFVNMSEAGQATHGSLCVAPHRRALSNRALALIEAFNSGAARPDIAATIAHLASAVRIDHPEVSRLARLNSPLNHFWTPLGRAGHTLGRPRWGLAGAAHDCDAPPFCPVARLAKEIREKH